MKKLLIVIVLGFAIVGFLKENPDFLQSYVKQSAATDELLATAYQNQQNDLQVGGEGRVISTLSDDTKGSRHQRFILELSSGQTLLVSHNIDIAPRINSLREGDTVEFYGEYEWSAKGGVVHWTHHDPGGRHENGWLKHKSTVYQ